jgi:hypothetical protein
MKSNFRTFLSRKLQRDCCIKSTYHGRLPTAACCSNCVISDVMKGSLAPAGYSRPVGCSCWRKSVLSLSASAVREFRTCLDLHVSCKMWSEGHRATELKVSQFIVSFHYAICSTQNVLCVRYQVLKAAGMKMAAFWDTAPRSLKVYHRFRGAYCLHHQGDGASTHL